MISRTTALVLTLLAGASLVGAVALSNADKPTTALAPGARVLPDFAAAAPNVARLTLTKGAEHVTLERRDAGWVLPDKGFYPAKTELARELLSGLTELESLEAKTAKPELLGRLQLDDPKASPVAATAGTLIEAFDAAGKPLASLIVGKRRASVNAAAGEAPSLYVRRADASQSWLAQGAVEPRIAALDWTERTLMEIRADKVQSVTITGIDPKPLELRRVAPDKSDFAIASPLILPPNRAPKSVWELNAPAGALDFLSFDDVAAAASLPKPDEKSPKATFRLTDGATIAATFVTKDETRWALFTAIGGDGEEAIKQAAAINARVAGWAYKLPDYKLNRLTTTLDSLLKQPGES